MTIMAGRKNKKTTLKNYRFDDKTIIQLQKLSCSQGKPMTRVLVDLIQLEYDRLKVA